MVVNKALVDVRSKYAKYLSLFPQNFAFCFAYGSGVFKQSGRSSGRKNMIDFIFAVENSSQWHKQNIQWNPSHYSSLRRLGHNFIASFQQNWGAKVYFNTLIPVDDGDSLIKYGVISKTDLVTDLLDWCDLYVAGRLHKPVEVIRQTSDSQIKLALQQNLQSAVHAALLMLPESFAERDLYQTITGLSYFGDFRMMFGEDKNKVTNIVNPQIEAFRDLYMPIFKSLHDYMEVPTSTESCWQNASPEAKVFHLNQLPKVPQRAVVRAWSRDSGNRRRDTEDSLHALGHDPDCGLVVRTCLSDIVWGSSVRQSLKGIPTAGFTKSLRYSSKKVLKMLQSISRKATKKAGKAQMNISEGDNNNKKKKHKRKEIYAISISKVLKQLHPDTSISSKVMSIMNNFVKDLFKRIAAEASRLAHYNKRSTIISREIQTAGCLLLPRELAKHAVSKGTKIKELNSKRETVKMSGFIGPALPPHLKSSSEEVEDPRSTKDAGDQVGHRTAPVKRKSSSTSSRADTEDENGSVLILTADMSDELFCDEEEEESYGPALPPKLEKNRDLHSKRSKVRANKKLKSTSQNRRTVSSDEEDASSNSENETRKSIGPALPSRLKSAVHSVKPSSEKCSSSSSEKCIGPTLPPELLKQRSVDDVDEGDSSNLFGPALPPKLQDSVVDSSDEKASEQAIVKGDEGEDKYLGPALPPGFKVKGAIEPEEDKRSYIGPALPPGFKLPAQNKSDSPNPGEEPVSSKNDDASSDSEGETVGPQLEFDATSQAQRQLELRARRLRHDIVSKDSSTDTEQKRESWMLELPPEKAVDLGLGPRQFRKRERMDPGDRSVWTDTPADRMKKKLDPKPSEPDRAQLSMQAVQERDEVMDKLAEKHSSKRGAQSLLEMHQEKLKKKKKKDEKEGKTEERRPFSRELDLQTNRFDEAQKKSIFNKARLLNDRFSAGQSKYL
ncbi:uncharacterized protein [Anabrus simplex]|uniref:uncharacterized protein n=1 Tax=Anabrus simplex TaxID=316456 RepID=UPI0035A2E001